MKFNKTPIDKILSKLKGVKKTGNGYLALCPAHKDKTPSLSLGQGRDGRVLIHCHAGCSIEKVLVSMHCEMKDLYQTKAEREKVVYTYQASNGDILFELVRQHGKQFYVRHKTAMGYKKGLNGAQRVLYRLPDVILAVDTGQPIFIVEGEKDVENLIERFNLTATTSPFGAGSWRDEYSDYLAGANVIILYDNDAAGRSHAQDIAKSLHGKAKRIRVVGLPNLMEGEDVSDWIGNGGTKTQLKDICHKAAEWEPAIDLDLMDYELEIIKKVEFYNKLYVTIMVRGKYIVIQPDAYDPSLDRNSIEFISPQALERKFANDKMIESYKGENPVYANSFKLWLEHPQRRDYDGLVFDPGRNYGERYFNLWRGFSYQPMHACIDRFLNHVFEVIATGDVRVYDHIIAFLADAVQLRPRPGVALALIGKQGSGKGMFVKNFGTLFGRHFLHITQAAHLTGRFNRHLAEGMIVFVDEAFWAGNKQAEGTLKALITEETLMIEPKNIDPYPVKNHNRLILASNNDWIVPAGVEERRFFVVRTADTYMQDRKYFESMQKEMNNGGHEGLLYYLKNYDLTNVDITDFPRTVELGNQKLLSMDLPERFLYSILECGCLFSSYRGNNNKLKRIPWGSGKIETTVLFDAFIEFTAGQPTKWFGGHEGFGIAIKKLVPEFEKKRIKGKAYYCLPSLETCRSYFNKLTKQDWNWLEPDSEVADIDDYDAE